VNLFELFKRILGVHLSGGQIRVAQKIFDGHEIRTVVEHVRGK